MLTLATPVKDNNYMDSSGLTDGDNHKHQNSCDRFGRRTHANGLPAVQNANGDSRDVCSSYFGILAVFIQLVVVHHTSLAIPPIQLSYLFQ